MILWDTLKLISIPAAFEDFTADSNEMILCKMKAKDESKLSEPDKNWDVSPAVTF